MSHFTHIKTRFQNLLYLKKALKKLNMVFQEKEKNIINSKSYHVNLVIPQSNGSDLEFNWNNQEYELIVDGSFWQQPYPIEIFIDKIAQKYAGEVIFRESHKIGFQPVKFELNNDGSNTLVLERFKF